MVEAAKLIGAGAATVGLADQGLESEQFSVHIIGTSRNPSLQAELLKFVF